MNMKIKENTLLCLEFTSHQIPIPNEWKQKRPSKRLHGILCVCVYFMCLFIWGVFSTEFTIKF